MVRFHSEEGKDFVTRLLFYSLLSVMNSEETSITAKACIGRKLAPMPNMTLKVITHLVKEDVIALQGQNVSVDRGMECTLLLPSVKPEDYQTTLFEGIVELRRSLTPSTRAIIAPDLEDFSSELLCAEACEYADFHAREGNINLKFGDQAPGKLKLMLERYSLGQVFHCLWIPLKELSRSNDDTTSERPLYIHIDELADSAYRRASSRFEIKPYGSFRSWQRSAVASLLWLHCLNFDENYQLIAQLPRLARTNGDDSPVG